MGIMGELFGQELSDEGSEDSDGQTHRPRFELDLAHGTIRLPCRPQARPRSD
jgi:hypothetical protein